MKFLKWLGAAVAVLVVLVLIAAGIMYFVSGRRIARAMAAPDATVAIPSDSASLEHGRHLVDAVAKCADCHGEDLAGTMVIDGMPFMRLAAPNITRGSGGLVANYSDADWVRVLRHGVAPDGHRLALMPSEAYTYFNDADLGAIIAVVKAAPPVDKPTAPPQYGPIARMLITLGTFPLWAYDTIDHARTDVIDASALGDSVVQGHYLMQTGGCLSCHGPNLAGGPIPGVPPETPPAANLTPSGIAHYAEADFFRLLREGKKPGGTDVDPFMPWQASGRMTDAEIHAVWSYLQTVPPAAYGSR